MVAFGWHNDTPVAPILMQFMFNAPLMNIQRFWQFFLENKGAGSLGSP
jgi:hypothetical protein